MAIKQRTPQRLDLSALSILVVDDQPFFRVLLTEILRNLGVRNVTVAVDGEDGLDAFDSVRPDIVITDWMMPKVDGIELARRIRAIDDDTLKITPIILVTANNRKSQIEFARNSGVDEFILKPVSVKSVCDRLREVIERPRNFIDDPGYTGPCRRRRADPEFKGPYRRFDDPLEITSEADQLASMRSILNLALARLGLLVNALRDGRTDIMAQLVKAVTEVYELAEDIRDFHVSRVAALLKTYLVKAGSAQSVRPDVIQTHLNAIDVLFKTPLTQSRMRDQVVSGLQEVVAKVGVA
ncbi:chemotaxis protein CheY [Candidatus Phycosocius bacilliformis]|uniref:Chemotaxis protein CheY n=1 Tax=Candidatus Phycosocius bacilliformis TaxID=1445552 RepID=A0A2P2E9C7_9PROT|nr:response regulator [Candidatus Phycosocius bacilliformis]GBF57662.1 chemotaxis protein CheY [Candidatus Phycosocius bacilliformis]